MGDRLRAIALGAAFGLAVNGLPYLFLRHGAAGAIARALIPAGIVAGGVLGLLFSYGRQTTRHTFQLALAAPLGCGCWALLTLGQEELPVYAVGVLALLVLALVTTVTIPFWIAGVFTLRHVVSRWMG